MWIKVKLWYDVRVADKSRLAVKMGKRGGAKGGVARSASMSTAERAALSRMAHRVRWSKASGHSELIDDSDLLIRLGRLRRELLATADAIGAWEIELGDSIDERLAEIRRPVVQVTQTTVMEISTPTEVSSEVDRLSAAMVAHPGATCGELAGLLYGRSTPSTRAAVRGMLAAIDERRG